MIKALIGLDLDGTVFTNEKKITDNVRRAIMSAIEAGFMVLPVSGRYLKGLPKDLMNIKGIEYAITSNGAVTYHIDSYDKLMYDVIAKRHLSKAQVTDVLEILLKTDTYPDLFAYGGGHMLKRHRDLIPHMKVSKAIEDYLMNCREFIDDFYEYLDENPDAIEKITTNFVLDEEGMRTKAKCKEMLLKLDGLSIVSGSVHNLEVTDAAATKGNALLSLADILGVDRRAVCAIGDDENDLDMIVKAGFGIAMGNAKDEVKKKAAYITKTNEEDGVVAGIEAFVRYLSDK
ncbi:MAG: HAD hydrolase family protein [Lachnospiraceae bacterium]|nr:HAD hydrolase family protein [Lachnospiraceae bacterium]